MASMAPTAILGLLVSAGVASASQWTVTSHYVVKETTTTYSDDDISYYETYVYTDSYGIEDAATATAEAYSTSTYTDSYNEIEYVEVLYSPDAVAEEDIIVTTTYDYDSDEAYTYYMRPVTYTAPSSCPTPFTVTTYSAIDIPYAIVDQITATSYDTSVYSYDNERQTAVTAYLDGDQVPSPTADPTEDFDYIYYIADCRNPTATDSSYWGPDDNDGFSDDTDDNNGGNSIDDPIDREGSSGNGLYGCRTFSDCSREYRNWIIAIAAILPGLFVLGFVESFFWFNRLMVGKNALRLGTICWILLLLPMLCFTRNTPRRDPQTRDALKQQWKTTSFGKKLGLWFKWGFRHKYPVDLLGHHPMYNNPAPMFNMQPPPMGYMPSGPPPPGGYIYYTTAPMPNGQQTAQAGFAPGGPPPPEGYKFPPPGPHPGAVPPGTMAYPQQPPQAYGQPPPQSGMQPPPTQHHERPLSGAAPVRDLSPMPHASDVSPLSATPRPPSSQSEVPATRTTETGESSRTGAANDNTKPT